MKMYSLAGEMLIKLKQFKYACLMYSKLRNCAYTQDNHPAEYKLFALKQMSFCYIKLHEYDSALKTIKKKLQLAWVVESHTAETQCYEMMAQCYYYKGNLKKCQYYNTRYLRGISEADFSRVRKINVIQSKDVNLLIAQTKTDFKSAQDLFTPTIKDFQMVKPEMQTQIREVHIFMANSLFDTQLIDPGSHLLVQCSPIQTPRNTA